MGAEGPKPFRWNIWYLSANTKGLEGPMLTICRDRVVEFCPAPISHYIGERALKWDLDGIDTLTLAREAPKRQIKTGWVTSHLQNCGSGGTNNVSSECQNPIHLKQWSGGTNTNKLSGKSSIKIFLFRLNATHRELQYVDLTAPTVAAGKNGLLGLLIVHFECLGHWNSPVLSVCGVGRFPFSQYMN